MEGPKRETYLGVGFDKAIKRQIFKSAAAIVLSFNIVVSHAC